jgi:hypothetical protein
MIFIDRQNGASVHIYFDNPRDFPTMIRFMSILKLLFEQFEAFLLLDDVVRVDPSTGCDFAVNERLFTSDFIVILLALILRFAAQSSFFEYEVRSSGR